MPAAAIAPIAGLAGSAVSGIFGNSAASAQADAAKNAATMHMEQAAQADRVAALNRQDQFPWMATGTNAINTLSHLMGIAGGTTATPWNPTYAGATPGAASPFMVRSPNGGNGTIANGMAALRPGTDVPRGTSAPGSVQPGGQAISSGVPMPGSANGLMNPGMDGPQGAPGGIMANGQGGSSSMGAQPISDMGQAGSQMAFAPGGAGGQAADPNAGAAAGQGGFDPNAVPSGDGSLAQSWTQAFQAPDNLTEQNDPGFQARMKMGTDALQNSAAARGNLLTGGTAKALTNYGQDYGSSEYGNVYNRALGQYQQNYNIFQNNQSNLFNRLSALAGGGQVAASNISGGALQAYGQAAQQSGQAADALQNAAYQRGSGYVNTGNAITGGLNNLAAYAATLKGNNSSGGNQGGWPTDLSTFGM